VSDCAPVVIASRSLHVATGEIDEPTPQLDISIMRPATCECATTAYGVPSSVSVPLMADAGGFAFNK